ncbi:NPC intracellular cholesterol transporter 2 homolog a-like [Ceratina calcarata]|uniref:NPC intracellular cholesterol transporter 2 homolog a-like n=1 Tax=Ceratina calcarata TaxID=156304 RepID=A0AAJ7SCS1_9HYME|nr:NPC intracellular cholesterol transporter 2 homolog a-like [Ceratina calcarata]
MAAIHTYAFVLAALCVASSMQTEFQPCAGKPAPSAVKLVGCEKLPCNLVRGTNAEAFVDFSVLANSNTLKPEVHVTLGAITTPYPLPQQDACKDLTKGSCPLQKGQSATYHMKMPVEKAYPKVDLTIQLALVDQNKNVQACFKIPAKVVD